MGVEERKELLRGSQRNRERERERERESKAREWIKETRKTVSLSLCVENNQK